jgi:hypothetical protein
MALVHDYGLDTVGQWGYGLTFPNRGLGPAFAMRGRQNGALTGTQERGVKSERIVERVTP